MAKIRKLVIPAAGLGTRFLPATKAQPKEMLPIVDKPTIQYIVEEAAEAGIEKVLIVVGKTKGAIADHFSKSSELETELMRTGKTAMLNEIKKISDLVGIEFVTQEEPLGLGHALLCAKDFVKDEPFAVILGDDVVYSETPAIGQLIKIFEQTEKSVVGIQPVAMDDIPKYGIVAGNGIGDSLMKLSAIVEKPKREEAPSNLAVLGRYVFTPAIMDELEDTQRGKDGEIQLTDAIRSLMTKEDVYAFEFEGKRYDLGDKLGFLKATVEFALRRDDLSEEFGEYLMGIAKNFMI